ncbi:Gfo/Idh/MocA family oxidoreductase [soil metagenome]
MVGGGLDAFIGAVHRKAAALDGEIELVCGAFSRSAEKSKEAGQALYLDSGRVYDSYDHMIEAEKKLPKDERMDAVSIVTPNHVHFDPAKKALENGFHVIIDKPIAFSVDEAKRLEILTQETGLVLALTHTYTGYPMVKEAKHRIAKGAIGKLRKIYAEYPQGWLSTALESEGNKQASWRTDPEKSGAGGAIGDIGTHAANLAEYISGKDITHVCADVRTVVEGRRLDDDSSALLKFGDEVSGVLMATQIAAGEENDLKIRVYGEKGGFEWTHTNPNTLLYKHLDQPAQILRAGTGYLSDIAEKNMRLPAGHPEGYLEAFANIYVEFARAVSDHQKGEFTTASDYDFPNAADGVRGMAFVNNMLTSSKSEQKWTEFKI